MIILREAQIQIYKTLFVAVIILSKAQYKLENVVRSSDNSNGGAIQIDKTLFVAVIILKGMQIQVYKTLFVAVIIIRKAQYKFIKRCS